MSSNKEKAVVPNGEGTTNGVEASMRALTLESDIPQASKGRKDVTAKEQTGELSVERSGAKNSSSLNYEPQRMIGHGSFGAVFLAKITGTNEMVAIKKVLQDRRFKNRELEIMRQLAKQPHPYVVQLRHYFITKGSKGDDVYLNLVLEYVPETMYSVAKQYSRAKEPFPILLAKIYMYQLARSLAHIHGMGICHRDLKPQNLLVDPERQILKLCDFGSAKMLVKGEPNVAYICSRYYRAPELIFGATEYTTAIDVWSMGCVFAELLLGSPMFPGSSGVDQLVEVIKVLGTPSTEDIHIMNPNYQEFKFPKLKANPLENVLPAGTPPDAIDLLNKLFSYIPATRPKAIEACLHTFFDALRDPATVLLDGTTPIPLLMFQFTKEEIALSPDTLPKLIPEHLSEEIKTSPNPIPTVSSIGTAVSLPGVAEN
eukprot:TRINITY_DN64626_c0_g1_i1.p1 TRINITY_DN64626_c0_g1~~TRINITY_DN64626_c0_g1_i1.p1  ORF type:complete len:428 (-),score=-16.57 TRINITY_DN64626_c0_g1_i1:14-1297(-)